MKVLLSKGLGAKQWFLVLSGNVVVNHIPYDHCLDRDYRKMSSLNRSSIQVYSTDESLEPWKVCLKSLWKMSRFSERALVFEERKDSLCATLSVGCLRMNLPTTPWPLP